MKYVIIVYKQLKMRISTLIEYNAG